MIVWGDTLCSLCRSKPAELVVEHERERDDEPLCIACADLWLERRGLELAEPELAARLVPLEELVRT